jgi:hypothetical protein
MFVGRFPLALIAILSVSVLAPKILPDFGRQVLVSDIRPSFGIAFEGKLSDPSLGDNEHPTGARLYLVISKPGTPLHRLEQFCATRYACEWFTTLLDENFPGAKHEVRRQMGPGGSIHQDIFDLGQGRYSVWSGLVYFSLPADVESIDSISRVELRVPRYSWLEPGEVAAFFSRLSSFLAVGLLAWLIARLVGGRSESFRRKILPGLVVPAGIIAILAIAFEFYLRFLSGN